VARGRRHAVALALGRYRHAAPFASLGSEKEERERGVVIPEGCVLDSF